MRRAFVAGSNGPSDLGPLKYARRDVSVLASPKCGFDVSMPDDESTTAVVRQQLFEAADDLKDDDTFICYFSGHGLTDRGSLFLLFDDPDPDPRSWC